MAEVEGKGQEQVVEPPSAPEAAGSGVSRPRRSGPAGAAIAVGKVFVQGLLFTVFVLALAFVFGFGLVPALGTDALAGNTLALFLAGLLAIEAVFVVATGFVNSVLTRLVWFPVHTGWGAYILQGIVIAITLSVVGIVPFMVALGPLPTLFSNAESRLLYFGVGNVILALFYGTVGRAVGGHWRKTMPGPADAPVITPEPPIEPANPANLHCPRCGGANLVVAEDHSAYCIDCQRGLTRESMGGVSS